MRLCVCVRLCVRANMCLCIKDEGRDRDEKVNNSPWMEENAGLGFLTPVKTSAVNRVVLLTAARRGKQ